MSQRKTDKIVRELADDKGIEEEGNLGIDISFWEAQMKKKEVESRQEALNDMRQDREQRKSFSSRIFVFMCLYMLVSIVIVFFCGFHIMELSEAIIIALLTTTLANVIGVFNFVAKYLFHK